MHSLSSLLPYAINHRLPSVTNCTHWDEGGGVARPTVTCVGTALVGIRDLQRSFFVESSTSFPPPPSSLRRLHDDRAGQTPMLIRRWKEEVVHLPN